MYNISNKAYDTIIRLLRGFIDSDDKTDTKSRERRRMAKKTIKYLKNRK